MIPDQGESEATNTTATPPQTLSVAVVAVLTSISQYRPRFWELPGRYHRHLEHEPTYVHLRQFNEDPSCLKISSIFVHPPPQQKVLFAIETKTKTISSLFLPSAAGATSRLSSVPGNP